MRAVLAVAAAALALAGAARAEDWRLEGAGSQASFSYLRAAGAMDAAGDRPMERMWFSPAFDEDRSGELWKGRRFWVRRQALVISCDWLTEAGLKRQQVVRLDGRDRGPELTVGDYGPSFIEDGAAEGQRMLALACGLGPPPEPRYATARAAIAYALSQQPAKAPELWIGGVPPPPPPPGYVLPQAGWSGSFYVVLRDGQGRAVLLDRASLKRRGDVAAVDMLTVLPDRFSLTASLSQVAFDCAARTQTVTGARRWDRILGKVVASGFGFTRPVRGLPAMTAALEAACTGSAWADGQAPVATTVAGAVAAVRG